MDEGVPFRLVLEAQDVSLYREYFQDTEILTLPESDKGIPYVRQWIKTYSRLAGEASHLQVDDNIRWFGVREEGKNIKRPAKEVLSLLSDRVAEYSNVAIASLCQTTFAWTHQKEVSVNRQAYSCVWVRNDVEADWRDNTQEDTDYSLQVLKLGWCTMVFNRLLMDKIPSTHLRGGNTEMYLDGGRERRALGLQTDWPDFRTGVRYGKFTTLPSSIWKTFPQRPRKDNVPLVPPPWQGRLF